MSDRHLVSDENVPLYEAPSIKMANEFHRMQRPRRCPDPKQPTQYRMNHMGEMHLINDHNSKFKLYDPIKTPSHALDEFGIGISIYFRSLKGLFIVIIICAFINLIAIYQNMKYNPEGTRTELRGTAYGCTRDSLLLTRQGVADIVITLLILVALIVARVAESRIIKNIDEDLLTTDDFSVVVLNPPKDCTDPSVRVTSYYSHNPYFLHTYPHLIHFLLS